MTREQLIREMIQIELLYQARRKILKESDPGAGESDSEIEVGGGATDTTQSSTPQATPVKNTRKKKIDTPEESSGGVSTLIKVGANNLNEFIKNAFENVDFELKGKYGNKKQKVATTLTDIKVADITAQSKITMEDDLKEIWLKKFSQKIKGLTAINQTACGKIAEVLMAAELAKAATDPTWRVFQIFEKVFPIQTFEYNQNGDFASLKTFLEENKDNALIQEIYALKAKDENQTYNTGKGEYLCVLLTKDGKSGGTTELDVIVNGKQYDVKQITDINESLNFTLSEKSDPVKKYKNKFIESYEKLGKNVFSLVNEFKKLGVNPELIERIEKPDEGYMASDFRKEDTYNIASSLPQKPYLSFKDIGDAYIQALKGLRRNTYANIQTLSSEILDNTKYGFERNTNQLGGKITAPRYFMLDNQSGDITLTYTPERFKIITISDNLRSLLKDQYNLEFKNYNEILAMFSNSIDKKKNAVADKSSEQYFNFFNLEKKSSKELITFFDVEKYNQILKKNIINPECRKIFLIQSGAAPIKYLSPKKDVDKVTLRDDSEYHRIMQDLGFTDDNKPTKTTRDVGTNGGFNSKKTDPNAKSYNELNVQNTKDLWPKIEEMLQNVFNHQIILTLTQMKMLDKIFSANAKKLSTLKSATGNSVDLNTKIEGENGDDEYLVTEPLIQNYNDGEFIIDISYYRNKKKRHVDTLHSQDFQIDSSTNNALKKASKDANITNIEPSKNIERVMIKLDDVISDKEKINAKLKDFQLFSSLQPEVLEKLFSENLSSISKTQHLSNEPKYQGGYENYATGLKTVSDIDITDRKSNKNQIIAAIEEISKKTNENNILKLLNDLNKVAIQLEEALKSYYTQKNSVFIFKDNESKYNAVESWTNIVETLNKNNIEGFITNITHDGIICYANPVKYENVKTIRSIISQLFDEIIGLMLDVQTTFRK
jgi:hypothetical protein